jgi:hypothetical protein
VLKSAISAAELEFLEKGTAGKGMILEVTEIVAIRRKDEKGNGKHSKLCLKVPNFVVELLFNLFNMIENGFTFGDNVFSF